jgi:hypothetical protein
VTLFHAEISTWQPGAEPLTQKMENELAEELSVFTGAGGEAIADVD